MLINKSNYELFALDYIEGNLDAREQKTMNAFLQAHPDLAAEIESMRDAMFTFEADENIFYENKASLLKKEEAAAVVFMQPRRWYQMAAAAAIAILLIGFGVGYFAGSLSGVNEDSIVDNRPIIQDTPAIQEEIIDTPLIKNDDEKVANDIAELTEKKSLVKPARPYKANTSKLPKSIDIEEVTPITIAKIEQAEIIQPIESKIQSPIAIEEKVQENKTQVAIAPLPKIETTIEIISMQSLPASTVLPTNNSSDFIANLSYNIRLTTGLSKIKNFLGKLPFEDATLQAFVPTYLANNTE